MGGWDGFLVGWLVGWLVGQLMLMVSIADTVDTSCSYIVGFKEMLEAPNLRRSGKKYVKHSTSSLSSSGNQAGTQTTVPVIAFATSGRNEPSSGLSGGQKTTKIRRALAKLNLLPSSTSRYCVYSIEL